MSDHKAMVATPLFSPMYYATPKFPRPFRRK